MAFSLSLLSTPLPELEDGREGCGRFTTVSTLRPCVVACIVLFCVPSSKEEDVILPLSALLFPAASFYVSETTRPPAIVEE